MSTQTAFTLTEDHIKLLRAMWVNWQDVEAGAPEIDPKRPYGNSDVAWDVAVLLEWVAEPQGDQKLSWQTVEAAMAHHRETQTALQIVLNTGAFEPGQYSQGANYRWSKVV